jgi:hypothetical protein
MKKTLITFFLLHAFLSFAQQTNETKNVSTKTSSIKIIETTEEDIKVKNDNDSLKSNVEQFFIINDKPVSREKYLEHLLKQNNNTVSPRKL